MSTQEAYKQKIEAELELAHAKLAELKANLKLATAEARIQLAKQVEELEARTTAARVQLGALGGTSADGWERFKNKMEGAREALSAAVRDALNKPKD